MSLRRHLKEAWEVPRDLALRRYPPFVTGGDLPPGHVPVFVFHGLEPVAFGRKLAHLAENDYRTLSAEEYLRVLTGRDHAPERAVVLTFDDGRGSLWSVGYPLMRRFGMCGIVFLVPGRTASRSGPLPPHWGDVEAGRDAAEEVLRRDEGAGALLSWEEVEALSATGVFDFQSHTLNHARIHVSPEVDTFMTPSLRRGTASFEVPLIESDGRDLLADDVPLGTPLLHSAPRTSEVLRFHEPPDLRRACVDTVVAGGGESFFENRAWKKTLLRLFRQSARGSGTGRHETIEERDKAIRSELAVAKDLLEAHTGKPVIHLCYPWHAWGPTSRRIAEEVGYETAFCGKVTGTPITLPGGDAFAIARLGEDYVDLLPGRRRATLAAILFRKWSRRFGSPS